MGIIRGVVGMGLLLVLGRWDCMLIWGEDGSTWMMKRGWRGCSFYILVVGIPIHPWDFCFRVVDVGDSRISMVPDAIIPSSSVLKLALSTLQKFGAMDIRFSEQPPSKEIRCIYVIL